MAVELLRFLARGSDGLVTLWTVKWGRQLWTICFTRKPHICWIAGTAIPVGGRCWRPVKEADNRGERISLEAMNRLERERNGK